MKTGIITFHNALNYGAVLQAYALQTTLESLGCESEIINYSTPRVDKKAVKPSFKSYRNPLNYFKDKKLYETNSEKGENIRRFQNEQYRLTEKLSYEELKAAAEKYDLIFTGSDQVWNDKITGSDGAYYIDFADENKRCSYAASIGMSEIPETYEATYKKRLSSFRAISVREKTAQKALKTQLGIDSCNVLDPTLLLSAEDYRKIAKPVTHKPYIFLYMLFYSPELIKSAKRISKELKLPVLCVNSSGKPISCFKDCSTVGIEEWLGLVSGAEFVLTNSFHGLCFSVNFNKSFNIELPPSAVNASSRMSDLLELLGLSDRIISDGKPVVDVIDYAKVNETLSIEKEKSLGFLKSCLDGTAEKPEVLPEKSVKAIEWDHCSGCGLCEKLCPTEAITMKPDKNGFAHPSVDSEKCIQCAKCVRECPFFKAEAEERNGKPLSIYAAKSNDEEVVYNSSSGGMFYELAKSTIEQGGVVYGAAFNADFVLGHRRVADLKDIKPLMGSKYMQSNAFEVFESVLADLKSGLKVLFVGTPCQVAALKSYCKGFDKTLLLVDFVCHGVPSGILLPEHIKYVQKEFRSKVAGYKPRSKVAGWGHHELFTFENGKQDYTHPVSQAYKIIFYKDVSIRSSCFNCPFTSFDRKSDLTVADYWGIEVKHPELLDNRGISMVLVNSEKGSSVFGKLDNLTVTETELDSVVEAKQPHLFRPLKKNPSCEAFWNLYHRKGWQAVAVSYAECGKLQLLKRKIKRLIGRGR